jgi:hypothetical protein
MAFLDPLFDPRERDAGRSNTTHGRKARRRRLRPDDTLEGSASLGGPSPERSIRTTGRMMTVAEPAS